MIQAQKKSKKQRVLVHCRAGISRSSTVTLAYMVKHQQMPLADAFHTLTSRRSFAFPNPGFWRVLIDWEIRYLGRASVEQDENGILNMNI
jgi:protein-tyrosine phosphatase